MTPSQEFVAFLVALLLGSTLAGLVVSRRILLCRSFGVYLAWTLITNRLVSWWPSRFYTAAFWTAKEALQAGLVLVVALELATVALAAFPRARRLARWAIAGVAALTIIVASPVVEGGYHSWVGGLTPRVSLGAAWAMLVVVGVAARYRLPLGPWHRTIALGFILYQCVYAIQLSVLARTGWSAYSYILALDPAAYAATVGLWMFGAWRSGWAGSLQEEACP